MYLQRPGTGTQLSLNAHPGWSESTLLRHMDRASEHVAEDSRQAASQPAPNADCSGLLIPRCQPVHAESLPVHSSHWSHAAVRSPHMANATGKRIRSRSASPPRLPKLAHISPSSLAPWTPGPYPKSPPTCVDELLQEPCPLTSPCMQWLRLPRPPLRRTGVGIGGSKLCISQC